MSDSTTIREGKNQFSQTTRDLQKEVSSATTASSGAKAATSERDLRSSSSVARQSTAKANIGFQIAFSVIIQGRIPSDTNQKC